MVRRNARKSPVYPDQTHGEEPAARVAYPLPMTSRRPFLHPHPDSEQRKPFLNSTSAHMLLGIFQGTFPLLTDLSA
jgi:hypothetical protein